MKQSLRILFVSFLFTCFIQNTVRAQLTLPWTEDFENVGPDTTFTNPQFSINGLSGPGYSWGYFEPTNLEARLRFNAGPGFAKSGTYAATLDDTLSNSVVSTNELILSVDLRNYIGQSVQLGFSYMSHNEDRHPGDSIWVRASFIDPWIGIYDLHLNRGADGVYKDVTGLNISAALTNAGQSLGQFVQIKFGQQDNADASTTTGVDGMTFDDVSLSVIPPIDGGVVAIRPPAPGCGLGREPVEIDIRNFGGDTLFSVPVGIIINGGAPITATINNVAIPPAGTYTHTFTPGFDFSVVGPYNMLVWTDLAGDFDLTNDSTTGVTYHNPVVSAFPYTDNFETNPQSWVSGGTLSSWTLTTPNMSVINSAASGQNSWVTQLGSSTTTVPPRTDGHNDLEQSFVEAQSCFDFSGLAAPIVRVDVWWNCETFADGAALMSSVDSGQTWQLVGSTASGTNWYNQPFINGAPGNQLQGWSGEFLDASGGWLTAEHPLTNLAGEPDVRFRFVFGSDISITGDGFAFDNFTIYEVPQEDGSVTVLNSPRSNCGLTANERIAVRVNNRGLGTLTNIPLAYRINGGTIVRETWNNANIVAGAFGNYTFNNTADLSTPGLYTIEVWTEIPADPLQFNDTLVSQVFHNQFISSFPYFDGFEGPTSNWTSGGLQNSWDRTTPNMNVINRAASGQMAWVTSQGIGNGTGFGGHNDGEQSFVLAGNCFDLSSLNNPRVRLDIWWHCETNFDGAVLQSSINGGQTWAPVGAVGSGTNWYNNAAIGSVPGGQPEGWSGTQVNSSGGWLTADHALTGLGGQPNVRFRVAFGSDASLADDGFAFDNFIIYSVVPQDGGVDSLVAPLATSCALGGSELITIRVRNNGSGTLNTIPVAYQVDNGAIVRDTIFNAGLGAGNTTNFTFTVPANLSAFTTFSIRTWTELNNDPNFFNDSLVTLVNNLPVISSFPYLEDFENGQGGWISNGSNDPWEFGTPAGTVINSAASGINSWMTGLSTPYRDNQDGAVESPCFDMSSLLFPMIRMDIWWETQSNTFSGDGAKVQYSTNGGVTWRDLGTLDPDWYNAPLVPSFTSGAQIGWMGNRNLGDGSGGWKRVEALAPQLSGLPSVKLRVLFQSGPSFSGIDGVAIDNIQILNGPADLRATRVISPVGGCGLGNAQVCFDIFNASSTSFTNPGVFYQVNNGPVIVELFNGTIAPNSTAQHCFTNSFNFGPPGTYDITMWLSNVQDTVLKNDTIHTTVLSKQTVTRFPYIQTFDDTAFHLPATNNPGAPIIDLAYDWENIQTDDPQDWAVWEGTTSSLAGPPADHTTGQTQYLYVEDSGFENDSVVLLTPCFDISGLANPEMRVWVYSEPSQPVGTQQLNEYSIDLINNGSIIYDVQGPRQNTGPAWQQDTIDLRPYTGVVGFRFRVNNNNQTFVQDIAIDDFEILDVFGDDVGVVDIIQPQDGTCAHPADSVYVVIRNFGNNTQLTFPIQVTTQGNSISINYANQFPSGAFDTVFIGTISTLGAAGLTQVQAWTNLNVDQNRSSDTTTKLLNLINPPAMPVVSTDSVILCRPDSAKLFVQNSDSTLNYIWYDKFANILSNEDTFQTGLLLQDSTFFVEASTGMNGLKISEIGLGFPDFIEVTNTSERVLDATGWSVYVGENNSPIDVPVSVSWPLGVFQPGEVQFRNTDRNSPFFLGVTLNWFNLPSNGWAMIVDDQCNLVDYVVWGHTQTDVNDFAPVGISGCGAGVTLGDYWSGPSISSTSFTVLGLKRQGDEDNNNAGDWALETNLGNQSMGTLNVGLQTGCVSAAAKVEVLITPTVGINLADQYVCGAATLDAGPGFQSYVWSTGATSQTITYSDTTFAAAVQVVNKYGCVETDTAVLSASAIPVINLGRDTAVCTGFALDGGNPGCDYVWSNGATSRIINFVGRTGANLVWAECTDPLTGCFSRDSIIITIRPEPDAGLPTILSVCDSGTVSVRPGVANYPLQWSTLATTPSISVTSSGTYVVTITDTVTGCVGQDSTNVTVSPSPSVDLGPEDTTVCSGLTLDAGTFPTLIFYDWSTGATSQTINVSMPGTYSITITDFNQCQAIDSMIVMFIDPPTADFSVMPAAMPLSVDFTDASNGTGISYSWDFNDGNTSSMTNPSHTYSFPGTYFPCLTVTDSCGNTDQHCDTVTVGLVSIEPSGLADELLVYPSPVSDILTVDIGQYPLDVRLELVDVQGRMLYQQVVEANSNRPEKIDMSEFAEGVYFLKLRSARGVLSRKILKGN